MIKESASPNIVPILVAYHRNRHDKAIVETSTAMQFAEQHQLHFFELDYTEKTNIEHILQEIVALILR